VKKFDTPMVTISQEEYDQLQECKSIINVLWMQFGPHSWPERFRMPKGKTFRDFSEHSHEFEFYQIRSRFDRLMGYDDSE
jgi:hypothetical protein